MTATTYLDIANEITSRFQALVADIVPVPTQYPNMPFTPPDASRWARVDLLDAGASQVDMTANRTFRARGLMQVTVHVPAEQGLAPAMAIVDVVNQAFRGVTLGIVTFQTPNVRPGNRVGSWHQASIDCPWYADMQES